MSRDPAHGLHRDGLPYIDNAKIALITILINLVIVFVFWPRGASFSEVLVDSAICALVTVALDMWVVYRRMMQLRAEGRIPTQVPISPLMQRLPKNPVALGAIYAVIFALLTVAINAAILSFYDIRSLSFAPWAVYKLIYATILSAKITEYCIFRYVQPDFATARPPLTAVAAVQEVKNPLPRVPIAKAMFGSVATNIGVELFVGLALGSVIISADQAIVVPATTIEAIPVTGLIFGLIMGILVTRAVTKAMRQTLGSTPPAAVAGINDRRVAWLPKNSILLGMVVCFFSMIVTAIALRAIMTLFGIDTMHFLQKIILITVYASILGKLISAVLVRRYSQPDYLAYLYTKQARAMSAGAADGTPGELDQLHPLLVDSGFVDSDELIR